jgi:subtilase family serine protease
MGLSVGASRGRLLRFTIAVGAAASLTGLGAAPALASTARVRVRGVNPLPSNARVVGRTDGRTHLRLDIAMASRNPLALARFAKAVSTPGSPQYGDYLSVKQFRHRFGPTEAHLAAVRSALKQEGLSVGSVTANGLTLPVSGSADQVQRAFSVSLERVRAAGGRIAYRNRQAPAVPAAIAPWVQGVLGLSDVTPDQPAGIARGIRQHRLGALPLTAHAIAHVPTNGGPDPGCPGAIDEQTNDNGLTADEIATAYGFSSFYGQSDFGQNQHIALVEEQPFSPTDVATYQACYGTAAAVNTVTVDGGPTPSQEDDESALDIEVVAGMAPQATIDVYQGPNGQPVPILSAIVSANVDKVISSSYGICEALTGAATIGAENTLLQEAATQGQSFFISSGDSGSSMCAQAQPSNTGLSVIDPGGQPFATGVGGTSLYAQANGQDVYYDPNVAGQTVAQSVWNDGSGSGRPSASGGGISSSFTMPSYQSSAPLSLGVQNNSSSAPCGGTTLCREVPDVSADADPNTGYVVISNGGSGSSWNVTGGTSAAAPLWASFAVLANDLPACRGLSLGFLNPSLYAIAGSSYNNNFTDIINPSPFNNDTQYAGTNDALEVNGGKFPVTTGYDMATGLGSMTPTLASSLCAARAPVYTVAVANPGLVTGIVGTAFALAVHGSDSGNAALTYAASGLPAGLAINPATGVISGTPTTAQATTVTVSATDGYTNTGSTQFTFSVAVPPAVVAPKAKPSGKPKASKLTLTGLTKRKPVLSFSLTGGNSKLKSLAVRVPKGLSFAAGKRLASHITIKSGRKKVKFKTKLSKGVLTVTLSRSEKRITVVVTHPAISITRSEALKIKHKKVKRLVIDVSATNAKHKTSHQGIRLSKLK